MSSSPTPSPTVNFFTSALLLFGGSFGGTHLTEMLTNYSPWHGLVGFLMFPIAFIAGMRLWPWVDMHVERIQSLLTPANSPSKIAPERAKRLIGPFSFVVTSVSTSILSGLILTPPAMQIAVEPKYKVFITAGAIYGIICWTLIQLGYLQQTTIYHKDS